MSYPSETGNIGQVIRDAMSTITSGVGFCVFALPSTYLNVLLRNSLGTSSNEKHSFN
jgi:hypothetical protein